MICRECAHENSSIAKYCERCGALLSSSDLQSPRVPQEEKEGPVCPECGQSNPVDELYCSLCGVSLRGELKQSGPGIASLVSGILGIFGAVLLIVFAVLFESRLENENDPATIALGLLIIGEMFLLLVGEILGIVGMTMKNRKKTTAIAGAVLNGSLFAFFLFLMVLGATLAK